MPFLVRCAALLRLCEDNDGDDEREGSSDENDAQCVPRLGPRERPDQSHEYSRGDGNDIDVNRCGVRLSEVVSAFHLNAPRVARIAMFERRKFNAADRAGCSDKGAPSTPR